MFKPVDTRRKYSEMENEQTEYWKENKTFEKSVEQRSEKKLYSFYDGPPFATGAPHYGHIVGSTMKDVIPRYWTMKGFRVERRWGWDCHGLPIENIAEKDLGISNKKEIEELGVEKFNETCRTKVLGYVEEWEKVIEKMGRWADMDNSYKTMDLEYMESVWWVFKKLYEKDLIYEGYRSMHICPRCETTLSQTEISEGYKDIKDLSVISKFELKYCKGKTGRGVGALIFNDKDEILLIRRKEDRRRETWAMPGGKVDEGETFRQALEREIKEELGVNIELAEPIIHNPEFIEGRLFDTVCYLTRIKGEPENLVPDETEKIEWFSFDNLPEIDYEPTENAIKSYLKDKAKRADEETEKSPPRVYVLAWTTTPWTLIGNVALAIGKDVKYFLVKHENDFYILAKDRINEVFNDKNYDFVIEIKGKELIGLNYKPLFDYYSSQDSLENKENGWKIYAGDFVTTEEGTGVVHIAPAFGEDDMNFGKENNLPFIQHVGMNGAIKAEAKDFAGLSVKPRDDHQKTDIEIIKYLAHNSLLFSKKKYEHSYPHCWRCDTPLINYATSSWFVAITKIKEKMLEHAKELNWEPDNIKEGRWGNWLEGARDWSISRQRYWASVMPIWKCECGEMKVLGSAKELEDLSGKKVKDLHKHVVDEITFPCEKCKKEMKRIPDVLDTWFDSGSMPYAQVHYPFENKEKFEKSFPAEFIAEGIDQTRAWFYYLHAIAVGIFDKKAFQNVIVNGIVLAEDGKKMAKKLQNYPDPTEMIEKYGADILRFYLLHSPVVRAQNLNFSEKELSEFSRGMFRMIQNSYSFFTLYASIDNWTPGEKVEPKNLLDKWILSELNMLIRDVDSAMEKYELNKATRFFPQFVDNLSNWYIRRSRKRFWKSESDDDKNDAYQTLWTVLTEFSKVLAPFAPFISEEIYRNLTEGESVHLCDFPIADKKMINKELNEEMASARELVKRGLEVRASQKIKVRQPLSEVQIIEKLNNEINDIIKEELNVKLITRVNEIKESNDVAISLGVKSEPSNEGDTPTVDFFEIAVLGVITTITPELKIEGQMRELIRHIQQARKEADFQIDDRIEVFYKGGEEIFEKFKTEISKEVLAIKLGKAGNQKPEADIEKQVKIDGIEINFWLKS